MALAVRHQPDLIVIPSTWLAATKVVLMIAAIIAVLVGVPVLALQAIAG
jgi:hypothetical protein